MSNRKEELNDEHVQTWHKINPPSIGLEKHRTQQPKHTQPPRGEPNWETKRKEKNEDHFDKSTKLTRIKNM